MIFYKITKEEANLIGKFKYGENLVFNPFVSEQEDGTFLVSDKMLTILKDHEYFKKIDWKSKIVYSKSELAPKSGSVSVKDIARIKNISVEKVNKQHRAKVKKTGLFSKIMTFIKSLFKDSGSVFVIAFTLIIGSLAWIKEGYFQVFTGVLYSICLFMLIYKLRVK